MQSLSKYDKGIKYLLCAIARNDAFQELISQEKKPNKIWDDQGSEFYNNSFKDFLKINNIEMYSTYYEGKSVVAKRCIGTLKNKIFKHMKAISKNFYCMMR